MNCYYQCTLIVP